MLHRSSRQEPVRGDRFENESGLIERAYQLVPRILGEPINLAEFRGLYSDRMIEADSAEVEQKEKRAAQERALNPERERQYKLAKVLEALVIEQGEMGEWLGSDVQVVQASEYDDLINGVDAVVRFLRKDSIQNLALGIDVTYSDAGSKLRNIREHLDRGDLTEIKYLLVKHKYTDEAGKERSVIEYRGQVQGVPWVVVYASAETVLKLARLRMDNNKRDLGRHPFQYLMLHQIRMQLIKMKEYARSRGHRHLTVHLNRPLSIIEKIIEEKKELFDTMLADSRLRNTMERELVNFQSELDSVFRIIGEDKPEKTRARVEDEGDDFELKIQFYNALGEYWHKKKEGSLKASNGKVAHFDSLGGASELMLLAFKDEHLSDFLSSIAEDGVQDEKDVLATEAVVGRLSDEGWMALNKVHREWIKTQQQKA